MSRYIGRTLSGELCRRDAPSASNYCGIHNAAAEGPVKVSMVHSKKRTMKKAVIVANSCAHPEPV
jgi:hypothetical protein